MSERRSVPITVLAPETASTDLVQRFAADPDNLLIASGDTLAAAGLLGLLRVGRAVVVGPDVTSRTPGCECCQVRVDLIDAVRHAVVRRSPARRVVVVVDRAVSTGCDTSTGEDPASDVVTAVHTLQADSEVDRLAHLDGVVVEIDAASVSTRMASGFALWSPQVEAALAIADRITLTRSHLVTPSASVTLVAALHDVNRVGRVVGESVSGIEGLVGLDAWREAPLASDVLVVGDAATSRSVSETPTSSRNVATSIETVVLSRVGILDPDATNAWIDRVIAESPGGLLRLQGALCVSPHDPRVCIRGSRSAVRSRPETVGSGPFGLTRSERENFVVVVGHNLDRVALSAGFESIEVAS